MIVYTLMVYSDFYRLVSADGGGGGGGYSVQKTLQRCTANMGSKISLAWYVNDPL